MDGVFLRDFRKDFPVDDIPTSQENININEAIFPHQTFFKKVQHTVKVIVCSLPLK